MENQHLEPGIYDDMPEEEYHASAGISKSLLTRFRNAPAKAITTQSGDTEALRAGKLIHTAVLEPHMLEARYVATDLDRKGTKAWAAEEAAAGGREMVKRPDMDEALRIRDAAMANPIVREIIDGAITERSLYWRDQELDLPCRGRVDIHNERISIAADLKAVAENTKTEFERAVARYFWHWQDVFYEHGFAALNAAISDFLFITVEKEPPYLIAVYECDESFREIARRSVRRYLAAFAECQRAQYFPGRPEVITSIHPPRYCEE